MATAAILDFWNRKILLVTTVQRAETHPLAKFCQNRSIGCEDIKIFRFFKMAAAAILFFWNSEFLCAVNICRTQMHQCSEFRQNRSFRCGDIAFFEISRWPPPLSWIFEGAKFYLLLWSRARRRISMPNLVKIGQLVAKVLRFFDFSRW